MSYDSIAQQLEGALRNRRLDVDPVEDTLNVSQGSGVMAHKANIDPRPLVEYLDASDGDLRRDIAGFVSGVKHVLLEPSRSSADEWTFVESAGGLIPSIEVPTFKLGVEAAADELAWTLDFDGDLIVAYFVQLDRGLRVVTQSQFDGWGVSADRLTSGARSILFHKTRDLQFQPLDSFDDVYRLHSGDGYDASRCFVVSDAFYSRVDDNFRFGLPSPDHFICVFDSDSDSMAALSEAIGDIYESVDYPLSDQIFEFDASQPVTI